jgi:hypothetical protein
MFDDGGRNHGAGGYYILNLAKTRLKEMQTTMNRYMSRQQ